MKMHQDAWRGVPSSSLSLFRHGRNESRDASGPIVIQLWCQDRGVGNDAGGAKAKFVSSAKTLF